MGYLKTIGTQIIYIGLFTAIITFLPNLPPKAEYSEYSIKEPSAEVIKSKLKNGLKGAETLFAGELLGPESFASYNGELYTGVRSGYVVRIEDNRVTPVVKFGEKCDGLWQEEKCGRPLGLKFNDKGELFVADAYYGIFKMNLKTMQYMNIVNSSLPIKGRVPKMVNSLDIAKNGDIYWSCSSSEFLLHDGIYTFLANPSGRLFRYDAATKENEVLIDNLGFANGVALSDDESFVIVLECLTSRIIKYNLKGPKAGQKEIFAEGLPGLPDNVHSDGQGGFLVSLIVYVDEEHPLLPQALTPHPYIRKMLSRLMYFLEAPFVLLESFYPNYYAEQVIHFVGSFEISSALDVKKTSVVLRMDKTGNVLEALYSDDRKVHNICSAYIHGEYLWLGSPWNEYIMRVPLKQAFPQLASKLSDRTIRKQNQQEPRATMSETTKVNADKKATAKPNAKPQNQETTTTQPPKSTVKVQPTQKVKSSTTTPKPPVTATVAKTPPQNVKKDNVKEVKKDNSKEIKKDYSMGAKEDNSKETKKNNSKDTKKDNIKQVKEDNTKEVKKEKVNEVKKDNPKEIKKDNSNLNVNAKPQASKQNSQETKAKV